MDKQGPRRKLEKHFLTAVESLKFKQKLALSDQETKANMETWLDLHFPIM